MVALKRVIVAVIFGFVAGIICYSGTFLLNIPNDFVRFLNIIVHRTLIGFVIGISALKMHWAVHGFIIGEIVGLPFFFFDLITGVDIMIVLGVLAINAVFGIMIEFFTSIVFKSPV
ncbi:MAG: hypothetical protein GF329_10470 [Candidatus Lokiarchaeota archaeon]|nr:hypothetical protein [Candidatus Lokiarchaeota archaeon]